MNERKVILAVEDQLGAAISMKILEAFGINVTQQLGFKGNGYLQKKAQSFNQTAKGFPVFLLTDQDSPDRCPPQLIQSWVKGERNPQFFLRIAVMEVESWIMADRRGLADFLSIPLHRIPLDTDGVRQPKEFLVSLARLSKKTIVRGDMVPAPGATSKVGPSYNSRLAEFVRTHWNLKHASSASMSLKRTLARLKKFSDS